MTCGEGELGPGHTPAVAMGGLAASPSAAPRAEQRGRAGRGGHGAQAQEGKNLPQGQAEAASPSQQRP